MTGVRSGLAIRALQPIVAGLEALGHPVDRLLREAEIPRGILGDPDGRVPRGSMHVLWESAREATDDELLGLRLALAAPVESFDVHAYAVLSSATLRDAYRRACRYQRLIHDSNDLTLEEASEDGILRHSLPGGRSVSRQPAEFLVGTWLRFGRLVTGEDWEPGRVCFAHAPPADLSRHEQFFGPLVQFRSGRTAMHVPSSILDRPNPKADPGLLRILDRHAEALLETRPDRETVSGRVRAWLVESEGSEDVTAEKTARALHMSARSLRRHLRKEGTSFRELLDGFRHERAVRLLSRPAYGIADVAFLVGFSELSSFYRAFRRWTGTTPSEFRHQLPPSAASG